jgi:tetratricopeptide (TPR) repeat protein
MPLEKRSIGGRGFTDHWIRRPDSPAPLDSFERDEYLAYLEDSYRRGRRRSGLGAEKKVDLGVGLAEILFARKSYDVAFETLAMALTESPKYTQRLRAAALFKEGGRLPEATDVLEDAIAAFPEGQEAYYQQAELLQAQGNLEKAESRLRHALALAPDSATAHNGLGSVLGTRGSFDEAIAHFQKALELESDFLAARLNLGLALQRRGRFAEARSELEEVLRRRADLPAAQSALARILATHPDAAERNPAEAVRLADRAAQLTAYENPSILDTLAAAYASAGEFEKAATVAIAALRIAPEGPLADQLRARLALYRTGKPFVESPRN